MIRFVVMLAMFAADTAEPSHADKVRAYQEKVKAEEQAKKERKKQEAADMSEAWDAWRKYYWKLVPFDVHTSDTLKILLGGQWFDVDTKDLQLGWKDGQQSFLKFQQMKTRRDDSGKALESAHEEIVTGHNPDYTFVLVEEGAKKEGAKDVAWKVRSIRTNPKPSISGIIVNSASVGLQVDQAHTVPMVLADQETEITSKTTQADGTVKVSWTYKSILGMGRPPMLVPLSHGEFYLDPKRDWLAVRMTVYETNPEFPIALDAKTGFSANERVKEIVHEFGEWREVPVVIRRHEHMTAPTMTDPKREFQTEVTCQWANFDDASLPQTRMSFYGLQEPKDESKNKAPEPSQSK
jgi:hypothetical protein